MNQINHIDETGKEWVLPFFEIEDINDLHLKYRGEVYQAIKDSILEMMALRIKRIPSFSAGELIFELNLDNINEQLDACISYYSEIEEYEICSQLLNLKE